MAVKHYVDEIPPSTGRVYRIETDGNTSKIIDETNYQQVGTPFGANDVNCACVLECNYSKSGTVHKLTTENIESENIKGNRMCIDGGKQLFALSVFAYLYFTAHVSVGHYCGGDDDVL